MADKTSKPLAGFDVLADFIVGNKEGGFMGPKDDDGRGQFQDIDPEELQKQMSDDDKTKDIKPVDIVKNPDDKKAVGVDKKIIADEPIVPITKSNEDKEYESEISTFFGAELAKKLKLEIDDKDLKFDSIDEVLELMSEIVNDNSKPTYASNEVEAYDEFVRNGGDLRTFYKEIYSGKLDPTSIDIEKEYDQRSVVRENLLNQGYKEDRIKKMISRYEEAETLKEEAEDALDSVKEFNDKKANSLLVQQKKESDSARLQQQKFYSDVNTTIKSISDIRGFPITEKQKRELLQYTFTPEDDGYSKYQKDSGLFFNPKSDVMSVLESAFLVMNKKQKLADDASNKGNSDAYKTLRDKLKAKGTKQDDDQKGNKISRGSLGDFGKGIIF